jgi:hypothetical protein
MLLGESHQHGMRELLVSSHERAVRLHDDPMLVAVVHDITLLAKRMQLRATKTLAPSKSDSVATNPPLLD